jgi:hypothetical protein
VRRRGFAVLGEDRDGPAVGGARHRGSAEKARRHGPHPHRHVLLQPLYSMPRAALHQAIYILEEARKYRAKVSRHRWETARDSRKTVKSAVRAEKRVVCAEGDQVLGGCIPSSPRDRAGFAEDGEERGPWAEKRVVRAEGDRALLAKARRGGGSWARGRGELLGA